MSINRVVISGNLTRDPELRQTQSGMAVRGLGVAVNDRRRNPQTNEWEDYPNFIDCTMFGARATAIQQYLHKGSKVAIEGKLRYSQWERDGQRRSKVEVIIDEIEFMSSRDGGYADSSSSNAGAYGANAGYNSPSNGYGNGGYSDNSAPQQANTGVDSSIYDEDIPF